MTVFMSFSNEDGFTSSNLHSFHLCFLSTALSSTFCTMFNRSSKISHFCFFLILGKKAPLSTTVILRDRVSTDEFCNVTDIQAITEREWINERMRK